MRFDSCWDGAGTFWVCNKVSRRVYQRTNHKYRHVSAPCFETAMIERNKHKIIIGYDRSYILNCNARIQWTCCCNAFDEYKASLACGTKNSKSLIHTVVQRIPTASLAQFILFGCYSVTIFYSFGTFFLYSF
ncbi:unnamed protein product [Malus baccata var. baccata]